ncbi:MAG: glycine betaine ABC transporter substrate-binding protein [Aureliella sp.]
MMKNPTPTRSANRIPMIWAPPSWFRTASYWVFLWAVSSSAVTNAQTSDSPDSDVRSLRIGSKSFTESVILGEMLCTLTRHAGAECEHRKELGGTQILWKALLSGEIDAYVEYSGTIKEEILGATGVFSLEELRDLVSEQGIEVSEALGFNNTYALGMTEERATELGITKISDLLQHPDLDIGFSDEFVERKDGWNGLKAKYGLPQTAVRALDHSLAYSGLRAGSIDVIDLYSTDPEIISYNLRVLEDDLAYFPFYEAVVLYRKDLLKSHPLVIKEFEKLVGKISGATMAKLNAKSRIDRLQEPFIAADFLNANVDSTIELPEQQSWLQDRSWKFVRYTGEHAYLVCISLSVAILIAVPLGIFAYKVPRLGEIVLGVVGVIQTIPSMALMVFMIPVLGLGATPAIVALFLYSLLPIVRGTHTGLSGLSSSIHESALALGLPSSARLRLIELPLAAQSILSGIKTAAVINVGTATIGALIGAGGYGSPILTGIRLADVSLILQGAIPAALLALLVQWGFGWLEKWLVPAGLKKTST